MIPSRVIQNYIVIEGVGGVGKTTLLDYLKGAVKAYLSWEVSFLRFPSDRQLGKFIRNALQKDAVAPQALAPLFLGDMIDVMHNDDDFKQTKDGRGFTICDRYFFSTMVYQQKHYPQITKLIKTLNLPLPGLTILLTANKETLIQRIKGRGDTGDPFDNLDHVDRILKWQDEYKIIPHLWHSSTGEPYPDGAWIELPASLPTEDIAKVVLNYMERQMTETVPTAVSAT